MNLGPLEEAIRQVVREEMASIFRFVGNPGVLSGDMDLVPHATADQAPAAVPELRHCGECGSDIPEPCGAADCGWPTGKPVHLDDRDREDTPPVPAQTLELDVDELT